MLVFLAKEKDYKVYEDYIKSIEYYLKEYNIQSNIILQDSFENFTFDNNNYYIFIHKTFGASPNNDIIKKSFIMNTEQLSREDQLNPIKEYINQGYRIIDYSLGNIKILNNPNIIYLPYLVNPNEIKEINKLNEIVMIEPNSPIRLEYLNFVKTLNIIPINTVSGWKEERDNKLFQYKILLNIHHHNNFNIFESIRCDRCVFNKMIILSEKSDESSVPDDIKKYVIEFNNKEELKDKLNNIQVNFNNYYNSIFNDFNLDTIKNSRLEHLKTFLKSIKLLSGGKLKKYRKTRKNKKKLKGKKTIKKGGNMDNLLICIAFHYDIDPSGLRKKEDRYNNLKTVLHNFIINYKIPIHIIIDTNSDDAKKLLLDDFKNDIEKKTIEIYVHMALEHRFDLTWKHREHCKNNLDKYTNFMYLEDDMLIPYTHYLKYMENLNILWPEYVPTFIRIEKHKSNSIHAINLQSPTKLENEKIITKNNKKFIELTVTYSACWILPMKNIKENLSDAFFKIPVDEGSYRENAASFPTWQLHKKGLVELDNNNNIIKEMYIKHLSDNYGNSLLTKNIFQK